MSRPVCQSIQQEIADFAAGNQHVGTGKIADLRIKAQHDAVFQNDRPATLQLGEIGVPCCGLAAGRSGGRRQQTSTDTQSRAERQKGAARRSILVTCRFRPV